MGVWDPPQKSRNECCDLVRVNEISLGTDIASWEQHLPAPASVLSSKVVESGRGSRLGPARLERHSVANLVHLGRQDVVRTGALGTIRPHAVWKATRRARECCKVVIGV